MSGLKKFAVLSAVAMTLVITATDFAEARRAGGGFGSRGTRTFSAPPVTRTAPNTTAPIDRTMTPQATRPNAAQNQPGAAQTAPARRPGGFFGGFGGSLLGGLALGGLLGMMMGNGFGGAAGFLGMLLQLALIAGAAMLLMRFLRNRQQQPATGRAGAGTGAAGGNPNNNGYNGYAREAANDPQRGSAQAARGPGFAIPRIGGGAAPQAQQARSAAVSDELGIGQADLERFETMLKEVQTAYGAEDYGALRRLTTPEAMSWLAEELSENATKGLRNEVRDVRLLQGDLSESWREDAGEFATVAMRYESIDVTRDRDTGKVVEGDPDRPTEATEVWTFFRRPNTQWQVSAIQAA
ncbi:putative lipid-binding transport protein (Tim44 family) [Rhizobium sp. PP-F2F-G48]|uniref:Tim44 domain-containing protein n=1 Tax=Rhizobium sp. PP-F2F-G48 TaxID=2135651 RepID=UPI0010515C4A|nr:Tim44 domain-containing protein [Rhizobium sp. PP-F2F-G48]TCM56123.1 putative lipid-binding transport protein (Tim44 family) [Rhizobium sp. PP-F2F-G48]